MILLPPQGLNAASSILSAPSAGFLTSLYDAFRTESTAGRGVHALSIASVPQLRNVAPSMKLQVLDSISENGAKLIKISARDLADFRMAQPGVRIVPVIEYELSTSGWALHVETLATTASTTTGVDMTFVGSDGAPVVGAHVVAFTTFATRTGAEGDTDRHGRVQLNIASSTRSFERVYVYAKTRYWPKLLINVVLKQLGPVELDAISFPPNDLLRNVYGNNAPDGAGKDVVVGVIDTGCGPHPDLKIAGGFNAVGRDEQDYFDNGEQHGTHVAGIIAAHGNAQTGVRGIAPGSSCGAIVSLHGLAKKPQTSTSPRRSIAPAPTAAT